LVGEASLKSVISLAMEPAMVWRGSTIDPTADIAASAVLEAFEDARSAGLPSVDCYRAGVDAWRRTHPDQSAEYAAKQAVAVILAVKVSLRVEE
jgi:hypothetical protein